MQLTIHRGTNEIGGSCVEIKAGQTRIIIDFGLPLLDQDRNEFNFDQYKYLSRKELINERILPDIQGLYDNPGSKVDAVLLSHPHQDHYGLLNFIDSNIDVYMGKPTNDLIELSNIFSNNGINISRISHFRSNVPFCIGEIKITPFWVDHSAYDSYMLLVEADGKRIVYSGDFRMHGRKSKMMDKLLANPPENIDYLILEGTNIVDSAKPIVTENSIENNLTTVFSENKPGLVYVSGQNIDRVVSIFKACQKAGKTLVVDVYIAKILKTLSEYNKFPFPNKSYNIGVWFTKYVCDRLARLARKDILYEFAGYKISKDEINLQPSDYVILTRPSQIIDMEKIPNLKLGNFIYSLWEGYKNRPDTIKLLEWIRKRNFTEHYIHTSGHAGQESLLRFVNAFNPKHIIPIHTLQKNKYSRIFTQNVISLRDGEKLEL